jgi:lipopolysaccharide/colanic/teichoic acid biosynthesis glycosyltransferase
MEAGTLISHEATAAALPRTSRATDIACRAVDIAGASLMLIALSPLLLAIYVAIRLDTPGGAIFRQRRVGRNLELFTVNKFRSMYVESRDEAHRAYVSSLIGAKAGEAEQTADGLYKLTGDARVTRIGRLLRRTSLDELPQLWNVLRGDMSLVGPRPSIPYEVEQYPDEWMARFTVPPGLTGLWQVSGRCQLTWEEMIMLDLSYVERRSLWMNVWILLKTVPTVLLGQGAA